MRRLGTLRVSPIGLGTVKFGRNTDVKYPNTFELPRLSDLHALLEGARDLGINLIDTAPAYGESESRLGQLLKASRDQWLISTKVGETYDGQSHYAFSKQAVRTSIEASLQRLRTDHLDIVLIHCDDNDETTLRSSETIAELTKLQDEGAIRYIGASTKTVGGGLLALEKMDLVMVAYNLNDTAALPVLEGARNTGKPVMIKKALSSGHTDNIEASLVHSLAHPAVATVVVGTINRSHLEDNVQLAVAAIESGTITAP